ncbi:MAG: hypothetical protein K9H26_18375 [Prolixibacteraceae bacterium]|nr:hypothetical protein [Prolixibacteraceae bacterium]
MTAPQKNEVEQRITLLNEEIHDMKILSEVIFALKEKIEPEIFSKFEGPNGKKHLKSIEHATLDEIRMRLEYIDATVRFYDIEWELKSKNQLLESYKKHIENSVKEGVRPVSDTEILRAIKQLQDLELTGKDKQKADIMINNFMTGNVVGEGPRWDYLNGLLGFVKQRKG